MTDPLAIIYVLLMGAVLIGAIVFDARRRKARRIQARDGAPRSRGSAN